ncbi:RagB/SusD family nutrient uptake outer membrane protein [Sphingobacterium chungjuense]|uniref:RagB/SusD family nutrient uptake outer membrane protein n=1 Tax=Sphingobacterium chungjuense TaxID=2675553 RepID=UPI00140798F9|nr:RagB/SusD family nutrient uptake outer membrane protein [Sphingobacterium chungjuense]
MNDIKIKVKSIYLVALLLSTFSGCSKILEEKSDQSLKQMETIDDLQALLNNSGIFNDVPAGMGEVCSDNVYFVPDFINAQPEFDQNLYVWHAPNSSADGLLADAWNNCYLAIYYSNLVIEQSQRISLAHTGDVNRLEQIKGWAHFLRAYYHLALVSTWRGPWTAQRDQMLAIPIRVVSDINAPNIRNTLGEVYHQVEQDMLYAIARLPSSVSIVTAPDKAAGYALASRFYLLKGDYEKTRLYADSTLSLKNSIMDYATLDQSANFPFTAMNAEVIFHVYRGINLVNRALTDGVSPELHALYGGGDLRRELYFRRNPNGTPRFKGLYNGTLGIFTGPTTSEVVLNQVEALWRTGQIEESRTALEKFLRHRYRSEFDLPGYVSGAPIDSLIKVERRKELAFRDIRWQDMQRYHYTDGDEYIMIRELRAEKYSFDVANFNIPYPENFLVFNPLYR